MIAMGTGVEADARDGATSARPANDESRPPTGVVLVLLVDDDPFRRAALTANLLRAATISIVGASTTECRAIASLLEPHAVISVLNANKEISPEVVELLDDNTRASGVFVGVEDVAAIQGRVPVARERLHGVAAATLASDLGRIINLERPVLGVTGPFSPAEYVQLAGLGAHSVTLNCVDAEGQPLGVIAMVEGRVQSARQADLRGFEAFAALVTRNDARVVLGGVSERDADANLTAHWQVLVLEAMRRHDERERRQTFSVHPRATTRENDFSDVLSEPPARSQRTPLARAASIPALPVTEMQETLGSTRGTASETTRTLVEEGVRAVIEQDYPRAIQCLERALAADPKNASVRHRLARLYVIVSEKR